MGAGICRQIALARENEGFERLEAERRRRRRRRSRRRRREEEEQEEKGVAREEGGYRRDYMVTWFSARAAEVL